MQQARQAEGALHAVDLAGRAEAEPPGDEQAGHRVPHPVGEELEVGKMHERVRAANRLEHLVAQFAALVEIPEAVVRREINAAPRKPQMCRLRRAGSDA